MLNSYKTSINDLENLKDIYKLAKDEKNEEILLDCLKIDEINNSIKKSN